MWQQPPVIETPIKGRRLSQGDGQDDDENDDDYEMNQAAIVKLKASLEAGRSHAQDKDAMVVESVSEDGRTDMMSDVRDEPAVATPYENNAQDSMGAFRMHYGAQHLGRPSHSRSGAATMVKTTTPEVDQHITINQNSQNERNKTKQRQKEPLGNG